MDGPREINDFTLMVKDHDLTFAYSDSYNTYLEGTASLKRIREYAAANLSHDRAAAIWNAEVDRRVREGFREQFYWSSPEPA